MFKKKTKIMPKHSVDELYDLFVETISIQSVQINDLKALSSLTDKNNAELIKSIEAKNLLLKEKEAKISDLSAMYNGIYMEKQALNKKIKELEKRCTKLSDFIKGATEKLIAAQLKHINRSKLTKSDYIAEGMFKMDDTTKARLK